MIEETEKLEVLEGTVEKITYHNEQNGYTVLILDVDGTDYTVVGTFAFVNEGDYIKCSGKTVIHANYGEQFKAEYIEKIIKTDSASVLRYLSSGSIKGVGPATAKLIVEKFGSETLETIENHPERLATLKGISISKAMAINSEYLKQFGMRDIMLLLSNFGITPEEAVKIYRQFGNNSKNFIKDNPYLLCGDGIDFSFERAELIAESFGVDRLSEDRLKAGILYVLKKNLINGHTCLPKEKLAEVSVNLLECSLEQFNTTLTALSDVFSIVQSLVGGREFIFLPEYHKAEKYIAARLGAIKNYIPSVTPIAELEIDRCENILGIKFGEKQREAIHSVVENGLLILTGGPGTGKTTTLNAIIKIFEHRELKITLAAPTGRAAQRMTELTGYEAKTIHRLLEVEWDENDKHIFSRNEQNPIETDVIIIDEMSMVDALLFENLLRALRSGCRIIMVGDSNQLPSVGAGNILSDLINSGCIPSVCLKTVFRQAEQSRIITTAHSIINGESVSFKNTHDTDLFLMHRNTAEECVSTVLELVTERLPKAYGFDKVNDIQVLCPSKKLDAGSINLNNLLQSFINPPDSNRNEMNYKGMYIRKGDKVMQIKNNYDITWIKDNGETGNGVFNGDIGIVEVLDKRAGLLKVRFDDRVAEYIADDIGQLDLAYAITVHKSQGSEFDCVVIPLYDVPSLLRYRNLLYTAVTRAKKLLIIVGREEIFSQMVNNDRKTLRYTGLNYFLQEAFG